MLHMLQMLVRDDQAGEGEHDGFTHSSNDNETFRTGWTQQIRQSIGKIRCMSASTGWPEDDEGRQYRVDEGDVALQPRNEFFSVAPLWTRYRVDRHFSWIHPVNQSGMTRANMEEGDQEAFLGGK